MERSISPRIIELIRSPERYPPKSLIGVFKRLNLISSAVKSEPYFTKFSASVPMAAPTLGEILSSVANVPSPLESSLATAVTSERSASTVLSPYSLFKNSFTLISVPATPFTLPTVSLTLHLFKIKYPAPNTPPTVKTIPRTIPITSERILPSQPPLLFSTIFGSRSISR